MTVDFSGWSRRFLTDGIMLYPPEGRAAGGIRIQDRVRPLRSLRALVAEAVTGFAGLLEPPEIGALERFVTVEGEYAGAVTLATRRVADGRSVERTLGMVVAEDSYTRVDGVIQDEAQFADFRGRVREVARHVALGLGWQRRRRYLYTPPPGWQAVSRTFSAEWYPLDHPRDDATITVFHAKPLALGSSLVFVRMLREDLGAGLEAEPGGPAISVDNEHGLHGEVRSMSGSYAGGPRRHFDTIALQDNRFVYLLRLESGDDRLDEHRDVLEKMGRSIEPLPAAQSETEEAAVIHWAAD